MKSEITETDKIDLKNLDEDKAGEILNKIYETAINGIPKVSRSVQDLSNDYLTKHTSPDVAANELIRNQVIKCATSGFITGLGGLITLPVAIPANVGSVMYVQMRMIAAIAHIVGYDIKSDQVQTMIYLCLTGTAISDVVKEVGIKVGEKTLEAAIKKIPGQALVKINQKIGFRFLTKFGEKGIINLGKCVPLLGTVLGGSIDAASTAIIGKNSFSLFLDNENPDGSIPTIENVEDLDLEAAKEDDGILI